MRRQPTAKDADADLGLIDRAVRGEPSARVQLIERLTPVIHLRVAHVLRVRARERRSSRQEVEDFVQEIFTWLVASDWRSLRLWDPARHASLDTFVGLLAAHRVCSILRSKRKSPWTERPVAKESLDSTANAAEDDVERRVAEGELLDLILDRLAEELGEQGMTLLRTIMLSEQSPEEIAATTGMSRGAIYTWKSRTAKRAREIREALLGER